MLGCSHALPPHTQETMITGNCPERKQTINVQCYRFTDTSQVSRRPQNSTLNESICEDISLHSASPLLVMGQLCIRRGCNTAYNCNIILGRLYLLQLFAEPSVAYKFLKNPKSCLGV